MDDLRRRRMVLGFRQLLAKKRQQSSMQPIARKVIIQSSAPAAQPRQRKRIDLEVSFNFEGQSVSTQAVDLSTGGIGIWAAPTIVPIGSELELTLRLPSSTTEEWLRVSGIVCYHADRRFGVRFVNLTFANEKRISELIAKH